MTGNLSRSVSGVAPSPSIIGLRLLREDGSRRSRTGTSSRRWSRFRWASADPTRRGSDLALVVYLGVFQLGLAYLCFSRGLRHARRRGIALMLLEPVLNPIWTFLAAGERPGPWAIAGGGVVLAATAWRTLAPVIAARAAAWGSRGS